MAALPLRAVHVTPGGAGVAAAAEALAARLDHDGPPVALIPQPSRHVTATYVEMIRSCLDLQAPVDDATAVVLATSGSTGDPRGVVITRDNLQASALASWERMPGLRTSDWVIALPVTSIGGLGALARAHLGGTAVHALESVGGASRFDVDQLLALRVGREFAISLVPTQLVSVLESPSGTAWLRDATCVLVGGAATPRTLESRARDAGIALVTTYGMTETTGGCVYDGIPLPGVDVELADDGRVRIRGAQVAAGYRGISGPGSDFSHDGGVRSFRTGDVGAWQDGRLRILGRVDDIVSIHGTNVSVRAIETIVRSDPGVRDAAVIALPDARRGNRLAAYAVAGESIDVDAIAARVVEQLGGAARPDVVIIDHMPLLPNGKIDRLALRASALGQ